MWPNLLETAESVTFTEEIVIGKLFFCPVESASKNCNISNLFLMELKFKWPMTTLLI